MGFIAQEVEEILPQVVNTFDDGYKGIEYGKVTAVLVEAVKQQADEIKQQAEEIMQLRAAFLVQQQEQQRHAKEMSELRAAVVQLQGGRSSTSK